MSEIDRYRHTCIGIVNCPSTYPVVWGRHQYGDALPHNQDIPLYRLDQDALDAESFQAKRGDILLGGGSGESAALRIAIPEAVLFLTDVDWHDYEDRDEVYCAFWSPRMAYIFGDGYRRLGWDPMDEFDIETWLCEHIVAFLVSAYPVQYQPLCGSHPIGRDGSICRKPTREEQQMW